MLPHVLSSVPDIAVVERSGVSIEASVSGVSSIWSVAIAVYPLGIGFGFSITLENTVTSISRIVSTRIGRVDSVV